MDQEPQEALSEFDQVWIDLFREYFQPTNVEEFLKEREVENENYKTLADFLDNFVSGWFMEDWQTFWEVYKQGEIDGKSVDTSPYDPHEALLTTLGSIGTYAAQIVSRKTANLDGTIEIRRKKFPEKTDEEVVRIFNQCKLLSAYLNRKIKPK